MRTLLFILTMTLSIPLSAQYTSYTSSGKRAQSANITFTCDCTDNATRSIYQHGGVSLSLDCSKKEVAVSASINPGIHRFGGMPIVKEKEAIRYKVTHQNGRGKEEGYLYYGDRESLFELEVEPGDMILFEVVTVNYRP